MSEPLLSTAELEAAWMKRVEAAFAEAAHSPESVGIRLQWYVAGWADREALSASALPEEDK